MRMWIRWTVVLTVLAAAGWLPAERRSLQPEDLYRVLEVADPQVSPDGRHVAVTVTGVTLAENTADSDIWLVPLDGGEPRRLTAGPKADHSPRWSPDGRVIAFVSNRDGVADLWLIAADGGEARRLTHSKADIRSPLWLPDGRGLVCTVRKVPEGQAGTENPYAAELPMCTARTIDRLLYRQWDTWLGDARNHVFHVELAGGTMRDLTPGDFDTPPVSLGSRHDFDLSPEGAELCYVRVTAPEPALSTNLDLYRVPLAGGDPERLTPNPALDKQPRYSPDGRHLAYIAMAQPGYESDTERLVVMDRRTRERRELTAALDRSVVEFAWHPDSSRLFFTTRDEGRTGICTVDLAAGRVERLAHAGSVTGLRVTPDGHRLVFIRSHAHQPGELYAMPAAGGEARPLTAFNRELLQEVELPALEDFWFTGADGARVHGFLLRPPRFDPGRKYPVVMAIHGGPQGMWADEFLTDWFTHSLITAPGYVGVFINPRGSEGYGARFREEVSRDYGGRCYLDLMAGLDHVLAGYPFVDAGRQAAVGGSFGGYSVNWIMGHTTRFKCLVSHAGLYNLAAFYGATEELWYPAWDMGETPWTMPELYARWSPHTQAAAFATPTLVTHGEIDFRVPVTEGLSLFTTLRVKGVPARLLYFPDEGHVIEKPQNNVRWWKEIHRWLAEYLK